MGLARPHWYRCSLCA